MPRGAFCIVSLDDVLANDVAHAPGGLEIEAPSYCVNVKHFSGEEEVFAGAAFQGVFVDRREGDAAAGDKFLTETAFAAYGVEVVGERFHQAVEALLSQFVPALLLR